MGLRALKKGIENKREKKKFESKSLWKSKYSIFDQSFRLAALVCRILNVDVMVLGLVQLLLLVDNIFIVLDLSFICVSWKLFIILRFNLVFVLWLQSKIQIRKHWTIDRRHSERDGKQITANYSIFIFFFSRKKNDTENREHRFYLFLFHNSWAWSFRIGFDTWKKIQIERIFWFHSFLYFFFVSFPFNLWLASFFMLSL